LKRLALIGYGKMGRMLETLAPEYGFAVELVLNGGNNRDGAGITPEAFTGIDAAIDFTAPEAAVPNLLALANRGISTVTGTTGWLDQLSSVSAAFSAGDAGLVWSPNFSIGVAVFNKLAGLAAELLRDEQQYGAWAWEIHHDTKKDAPSGTLLRLVDTLREHGYERTVDVASNRAGKHPGTHEIGFDSAADTITLRHAARSREGFARGALKAAQWIIGRRGVYTFDEVLFGANPRY
jgi:4-hydroxy-tetrahydrodipicolinate reductase